MSWELQEWLWECGEGSVGDWLWGDWVSLSHCRTCFGKVMIHVLIFCGEVEMRKLCVPVYHEVIYVLCMGW